MGIKLNTIFELLKNYDTYGFDLLYENYFRLMYGVAFSICNDDEISKDAIQNTMMNLYKLAPKKFPNSSELSWLYKVVKNETLQLLRKEKAKISVDDMDDIPALDKSIETIVDMDSYNYLIKNLNEEQIKIVTLKIVSGLTHKEISQMLNIPIGTVLWSYNVSIKKIRTSLEAIALIFIILVTTILHKVSVNPQINNEKIDYSVAFNLHESKSIIQPFNWLPILYILCAITLIGFIILYIKSDRISLRILYKNKKKIT